jgi:hypothetical protein
MKSRGYLSINEDQVVAGFKHFHPHKRDDRLSIDTMGSRAERQGMQKEANLPDPISDLLPHVF